MCSQKYDINVDNNKIRNGRTTNNEGSKYEFKFVLNTYTSTSSQFMSQQFVTYFGTSNRESIHTSSYPTSRYSENVYFCYDRATLSTPFL